MYSYDGPSGSGFPRETDPAGFPEPGMPSSPSSMVMPAASLSSPSHQSYMYNSPGMPSPTTGHYDVHDDEMKKNVRSILQSEPRIVVVEPVGPQMGFPVSMVTSPPSMFLSSDHLASPLHRREQSWSSTSELSGPYPTVDDSLRHRPSSSQISYTSSHVPTHTHDQHLSEFEGFAVPSSSSFKGHSECHDVYSTLPPALELVSTSSDWTPVPRTTRTKPSVAKPAKSPTPHQSGGRQTTQAQAHSSSTSSGRMGSHVVNSHDQKKPKKSKKGKGKGGCIIM